MQFANTKNTASTFNLIINVVYIQLVKISKNGCGICMTIFADVLQNAAGYCIMMLANVPKRTEKELIGKKCLTL